jgi:hypothetical protein
MKPEYKIVTYTDGIQRVCYTYKYNDAVELFHIITKALPYAELWEGTRLVQSYDSQSWLLA